MTGFSTFPLVGRPMDGAHLDRAFPGQGARYHYLKYLSTRYEALVNEEFEKKALDTTNDWTVPTVGGTATTWARTAGGTFIRGAWGATAATSGLQLLSPSDDGFGDQNLIIMCRYRASVITEKRIEIGFSTTQPAVNTNMVNSLATPTFNTTANAAVYVYDHTGSTTTTGLYTIGTAIAARKKTWTTNRPVAATWQWVRIEIATNFVRCWVDGVLLADESIEVIEGGTAGQFSITSKSSDTTDGNLDIDRIFVAQQRAA